VGSDGLKDLFAIAGKTALVTGGSRGIGAMIARGYVESGVKTYICARKAEELQATAEELCKYGECIAVAADLSSVDGVKKLAAQLSAAEKQLDILVNNAGATWGAPVDEFPESGWDKIMDLNVKATFFLTQQLLPLLRSAANAEDPARVINISSINALRYPQADNFSYSASKAAVLMLTQHLSATLCAEHINVNAIAPGLFPSNMTAFMLNDASLRQQVHARIPMGRMGDLQDIAGTAIYLASRASAYVSGSCIVVDGGIVASV